MPDLSSVRKPPRRFWLFAPYGAMVIVVVVWSVVWLALAHRVAQRLDEQAAGLRGHGWTVRWSGRSVGGYPFRLDVGLQGLQIAEPSGWALATPRLDTEAYVYAPDHWVLVAPQGVTLTRPGRGAVDIAGQALRASIVAKDQMMPRIAIEGVKLTLTPQAGALPLPIVACDHFGLYLRPLDGDQAEFQLQLQGASATPGGLMAKLDQGKPMGLVWDQTLSQVSSLKGPNWPAAVRAWSAAGGALTLAHGEFSAADLVLTATSGRLSVGPDGRPAGSIALDLSHAAAAPSRLGPLVALASLFKAELTLKNGALLFGPFKIGNAPKVY